MAVPRPDCVRVNQCDRIVFSYRGVSLERGFSPARLSHSKMPVEYHHAACRYALSLPQVCCAVIGMATPWELEQNLHRARTFQPLSPAEARRLQETGAPIARQWNDHLGPVV